LIARGKNGKENNRQCPGSHCKVRQVFNHDRWREYSTFDEQLGKSIQKGQRITITYIDNKASTGITYHNIKTLQIEKAQAHDFESKKYRAMCLSYAKDLAVAGNTSIKNMLSLAKDMYEWVIK